MCGCLRSGHSRDRRFAGYQKSTRKQRLPRTARQPGHPGGKVYTVMRRIQKPFSESGSSPPFLVTLNRVQIMPDSTVAPGEGIDQRGRVASFGCDWRPMLALAEALEAGEVVEITLDQWQVLAWRRS